MLDLVTEAQIYLLCTILQIIHSDRGKNHNPRKGTPAKMAAVSDKQEGLSEVPSLGPYHTPVEKESLEENVDVIESAEGGVDDHVTLKTWLVILVCNKLYSEK